MFASLVTGVRPLPASADVSSAWQITGGGWGHGLGMSQWGAKGYADSGWNATQIIQHFYSGTTVGTSTVPSSVRVGIAQEYRDITIIPSGTVTFKTGTATVATAQSGETWHIVVNTSNGAYSMQKNGTTVVSQTGRPGLSFVATWDWAHGVTIKVPDTNATYRWGSLELNTYSTSSGYRMRAVVVVPGLDKYLYDLGEVPSSWPAEALKAQVIAARTYAVEKINRLGQNRAGCDCGMYGSTADQAYVGYGKETGAGGASWVAAVDATSGKLALYNGAPIQAYYASSDGGMTENNENVWGGSPLPYLRGVSDAGDTASPDHSWTVTLSTSAMDSKLNAFSDTAVGSVSNIQTLSPYGVSGRVLSTTDSTHGGVLIQGSSGTKHVSGARFQEILGLKSTKFRVAKTTQAPPVLTYMTAHPYLEQVGMFVAAGMLEGRHEVVTGLDAGSTPTVRVFFQSDPNHLIRTINFDAYSTSFRGGVRVAVGDVDAATPGDEIVTAPGPGTWGRVRIWSLNGGLHLMKEFDPYAGWQGGVAVAVGNVDGTGPEIVTAPGPNGNSAIRVFKFQNGTVTRLHQFNAYFGWSGDVRIATGNFDGSGTDQIAIAPGPNSTPQIRLFRAAGSLVRSFTDTTGSGTFTGGAFVGSADMDGDHKDELLVSFDKGTWALVKAYHEATASILHVSWYAFSGYQGGVRTAGLDLNGDGKEEVLAAVGPNGDTALRIFTS